MRDALWQRLRAVDREIWILLALSSFAWMPLLAPGYFLNAHDAPHTLFFLRQFDQAMRDGYLIPRWGTDFALGYGYPLFLFYSPLAYYVAEGFHLLGANATLAVKLTYAVGIVLSGLSMYYLGRRLFGRAAGLLAGLLYVYAPYHLLDVYVRSDLTESLAYIFMPLTLLAFLDLTEQGGRRNLAWAGLSYAGLMLAHNGTALVFTPLLIVYVLFLLGRRWRHEGRREAMLGAVRPLAGAFFAAGLAAFFLLPALIERKFIVEDQWIQGSFNYLKHFVYPSQLLSPFWGFGYAGEGTADQMSFQLGVIPLTFAMAAVTLAWKLPRRRGDRDFLIVATIAVVFFMLPVSSPLWNAIPIAALVQFPWRLLILSVTTLALLGASLAATLAPARQHGSHAPVIILALVIVLGSFQFTLPEYTERSPRSEESAAVIDFELVYPPDRVGMVAWTGEQPMTTPLVPQYLAGEPLQKAHAVDGNATVEMIRHGGSSEEVRVQADSATTIEFYTYYFPGWRATIDGTPAPIRPTEPYGLMAIDVPAGEHTIRMRFSDTPVRIVGKAISALCLIVASWLILRPGSACGQRSLSYIVSR